VVVGDAAAGFDPPLHDALGLEFEALELFSVDGSRHAPLGVFAPPYDQRRRLVFLDSHGWGGAEVLLLWRLDPELWRGPGLWRLPFRPQQPFLPRA